MGRLFQIPDSKFLDMAEQDYGLWRRSFKNRSKEYKRYVNQINKIFGLEDTDKFDTKRAPKFWAGKRRNPRFIFVSLNPGQGKERNKRSNDKELAKNWDFYKKKRDNEFKTRGEKGAKSKFFLAFYKILSGLDNVESKKKLDWYYFHKHALNLNLFPFHSKTSQSYPSRFSAIKLAVIMEHLALLLKYIEKRKPDMCFFNGKVWETLFIKHGLISENKIKDKITFRNGAVLYFFKYNKKKYVLLNRFLSYGSGLTDDELRRKMPKAIKTFLKIK